MRFFKWLAKFVVYYRQHGFFWLCRHIFTNLAHFNKLVILETEIKPGYEQIEANIPVNIRVLANTEEDINRLTDFWPDVYTPSFATREAVMDIITKRLRDGELYLVAEHNGNIVHMNWLGFHNNHFSEFHEKKRGIGPSEALSHSTYCAVEHRGNHLMSAVRSQAFRYLLNNGYKVLINYTQPDNQAAMRVAKRFGGRPVQMVYAINIIGIRYSWLSNRINNTA